jgi:predicted S18 family serine protease
MKKLAALPLILLLTAAPAVAGSADKGKMDPEVIAADASSSASTDHAVFYLMNVLILLAATQ